MTTADLHNEDLRATDGHGTVHIVSLGCSRNDVDSEELAGRLAREGWTLVDSPQEANVAVVNTCGFVAQAKKDSIDEILALSDLKDSSPLQAVVAVGCLSERYGRELQDELSEADGVLGFDSYQDMSGHLQRILAGDRPRAHVPHDRRALLPVTPVARGTAAASISVPGHGDSTLTNPSADADDTDAGLRGGTPGVPGSGPASSFIRHRLGQAPWAPLKIASGCDRRCTFCAIPSFRGAFVSRRPTDVLAEARWLAQQGVRELFLVSENSTSYGKDLGDLRLLDSLLPSLADLEGVQRVRVSYLQPAELREDLVRTILQTTGVVPYFDLSFQHVAPTVLRAMRRFGDAESFLALIDRIRHLAPQAGIRSNVIVGFPGESAEDFDALADFVAAAELDVCGVFGYSDEDGTAAAASSDKVAEDIIAERVEILAAIAEEASARRANARIGEHVRVLIEEVGAQIEGVVPVADSSDSAALGRAEHQGPEVDGTTTVIFSNDRLVRVGDLVDAQVTEAFGVDLVAVAR